MGEKKLEIQKDYRRWALARDLVSFEVVKGESDLFISAEKNLASQAEQLVEECRTIIRDYITRYPQFELSLQPVSSGEGDPEIIREMIDLSQRAGVGPMAAVAGAVSEYVGKGLLNFSSEVIVENGGDIFIKSRKDRSVGIYAGKSPFSGRLSLKIRPSSAPKGVCTSSGTVGHSLSFGKADSVTIISSSAVLSDAAATAVANLVKNPEDIGLGLERAKSIKGIEGVLVIVGKKFGAWGKIEIDREIRK